MKKILSIILFFTIYFNCNANVIINNNINNDSLYSKIITKSCELLQIDSIFIIISEKSFNNDMMDGDRGSINMLNSKTFYLNVEKNMSKGEAITILVHEIQHIKQLLEKRLVIRKNFVWYEGIIYTASNSVYENRPFEVEAIKVSHSYFSIIKNYLNNK
jgi:hypothetical protein